MLASSEERRLEKTFGGDYLQYRERVPFIVPLLPRKAAEVLRIPSRGAKRYLYLLGALLVLMTLYLLPLTPYLLR